jgi:ActR/RegA family two-component response regulator
MSNLTTLLVDSPGPVRQRLERGFAAQGHRVVLAERFGELPEVARSSGCSLLVTEAVLGPTSVTSTVAEIRRAHADLPIVVLSTFASVAMAVRAMRAGATLFLIKPRTAEEILAELRGDHGAAVEVTHPSFHRAIWEYLQECLSSAGSVSAASRRLGLERRSLRRMLQKSPPMR